MTEMLPPADERDRPMTVTVRMYRGVASHFPSRRSEWVLSGILFGWGAILLQNPTLFQTNEQWSEMQLIMPQWLWATTAVVVAVMRLMALLINGTFQDSWYGRFSPHVRASMSALCCFIWLQISYGLWHSDGATTGLAVYPGLLILDITNIMSAIRDAGELDRAKRNGRA